MGKITAYVTHRKYLYTGTQISFNTRDSNRFHGNVHVVYKISTSEWMLLLQMPQTSHDKSSLLCGSYMNSSYFIDFTNMGFKAEV